MKHPSISTLALYSGGDLPLWSRWWTRRHVSGCAQCRQELRLFAASAAEAAAEVESMPPGVDWTALSAEMRANIHLGLEASEAIRAYDSRLDAQRYPTVSWKTAAFATATAGLLLFGYWSGAVRRQESLAVLRAPQPVVVEASSGGVGLSDGKKTLKLTAPRESQAAEFISISTGGSAGARYVDEETGQITVNNVYLD